jgi:hypothetical protein
VFLSTLNNVGGASLWLRRYFGGFLTQGIVEKQSDISSAVDSRKWDSQYMSADHLSSVTTHKWVDDDSESENDYITIPRPVQNTEYVTESMLKKFIDDQNATMMSLKEKSLDTLNSFMYVQDESDQDCDFDMKKRKSSDEIASSSVMSAKRAKTEFTAVNQKEAGTSDLGRCDVEVSNGGSKKAKEDPTSELFAVSNNIVEEKTSEAVTSKLADLVNKLFVNKFDDTKKNDLFDKHLRPDNCKLEFPRVNDFVWNYCMKETTRSADVKVHKIKKTLLKGLDPDVKGLDNLLKSDGEFNKNNAAKDLLDGVVMSASANTEQSLNRKACIKTT